MELLDMLLKGMGGNQQQQPQMNTQQQQEELRNQQSYQDLQNEMMNRQQQQPQQQQPQVFQGSIEDIAGQLGIPADKAQDFLKMGLPLILGKLGQNTQTEEGAQSLADALNDHANRQYNSPAEIDENDGKGILGHIFGSPDTTERVGEEIGNSVGVDKGSALKMLTMLAPLALAFLARKKKAQNLDPRGVRDLTKRYSEEMNDSTGGMLFDILKNLPQGQQQEQASGGLLGGLLGSLFGK